MTNKGRMRPWRTRPLTPGERALCLETFGAQLDLDRVRLWSCPPLAWTTGRPFCAGGWLWPGRRLLVYPPGQAHADFGEATLWDQSVFLHEMTHVWQSQEGVNLLWAKLRAGDGATAYAYELTPDAFGTASTSNNRRCWCSTPFSSDGGAAPRIRRRPTSPCCLSRPPPPYTTRRRIRLLRGPPHPPHRLCNSALTAP